MKEKLIEEVDYLFRNNGIQSFKEECLDIIRSLPGGIKNPSLEKVDAFPCYSDCLKLQWKGENDNLIFRCFITINKESGCSCAFSVGFNDAILEIDDDTYGDG